MIDTNILWSRAIDPISGKLHKEPTVIGSSLLIIGGSIAAVAVAYTLLVLFSAL